ncbi:uncharacterized protein [Aristolochia californica]|uniref:uncharacterized protein isoform X1 n=1 Tax=Aristolochia californica TaxID=171875 RepID=UPI0035E2E03A
MRQKIESTHFLEGQVWSSRDAAEAYSGQYQAHLQHTSPFICGSIANSLILPAPSIDRSKGQKAIILMTHRASIRSNRKSKQNQDWTDQFGRGFLLHYQMARLRNAIVASGLVAFAAASLSFPFLLVTSKTKPVIDPTKPLPPQATFRGPYINTGSRDIGPDHGKSR